MEHWLRGARNAFEFCGVPQLVIPDNTKTGVTKVCYEPDLNPTYQEFAAHYHVGVLPARPRKPRDKAKVESAVQVVQRWIVMRLRQRRFFSVAEANQAIRELLLALNQRPFRKRRQESRASLFEKIDRPALQPLPAERYDLSQWVQARVNIDYHVAFDGNWYSVPYGLTGELVEVRATPATVEIFHRGKRVASHLRSRERNKAVTQAEHRPKSHQAHLEWTPSRMVSWAAKVGPHTAQLVERILDDKPHPEMGYRSVLGLIRSGEELMAHGRRRAGTADRRHRLPARETILEKPTQLVPPPPEIRPSRSPGIAGRSISSRGPMLQQPT
jgi:transposase